MYNTVRTSTFLVLDHRMWLVVTISTLGENIGTYFYNLVVGSDFF